MASIVREMDGFVDGGPMYWAFIDPINTAGNEESVEVEKATEKLQSLFAAFSKDELKEMTRKQVVRGATRNFNLSREDRLCIALNWGNEDNQRKLVDGYNGLTEADVIRSWTRSPKRIGSLSSRFGTTSTAFGPGRRPSRSASTGSPRRRFRPPRWLPSLEPLPAATIR